MATEREWVLRRARLGGEADHQPRCSRCGRMPLIGELLHVFEGERSLCSLCLESVPETQREPLRQERVRPGDRHLRVAPRAA